MKFGSKLKGLFFEVEDEPKDTPNESVEDVEEVVEEKLEKPDPVMPPTQEIKGETNQEIFDNLSNSLEKANIEGFDYFEFAQVLDKLKEKMPSEEARFTAAFASGSVMGVTKQKLNETAEHYLGILNEEAEKFAEYYKDQLKRTVTDKEESIAGIDSSIEEKRAQIQVLEDEINGLSKEKTAVNNEIIENKNKSDKVKNDFMTTLKIFVDKINSDIEKINKYITD